MVRTHYDEISKEDGRHTNQELGLHFTNISGVGAWARRHAPDKHPDEHAVCQDYGHAKVGGGRILEVLVIRYNCESNVRR